MKPMIVKCPTCSEPAPWSRDNPVRPFCSERCRLIDLGQWADGAYQVPGEAVTFSEAENDAH